MKRRKKQPFDVGDVICIPLEQTVSGLAQVVAIEPEALNSVVCAFFVTRLGDPPTKPLPDVTTQQILAVQFVSRDLLDSGVWIVAGNQPAVSVSRYVDLPKMRQVRFVGTRVLGSAIAANFLRAYFGLAAWNRYHDPNYFDKLLASPSLKPANVRIVPKGENHQ